MAGNGVYLGAGTATTKVLWHMEGNSNDSSGNGNNGTDTTVSYGLANGKFGQGASLGGASKIVKATNLGIAGTGAVTISGWWKLTAEIASSYFCFWNFLSTLTAARQFSLYYNYNAGTRRLELWGAAGVTYSYNISLGNTQYYNFIATRASGSGGNIALYINGNVVIAPAASATNTTASDTFGWCFDHGSAFCPSVTDEAIVENVVWIPSQIKKYYTFARGRFA